MAVHTSLYDGQNVDASVGRSYVPTLNAAPTSSTLTFLLNGNTVSFEIGQFAKVAATGGYNFYQMTNLSSGVATWEKVDYGGGKADKVASATSGNLAGLDGNGNLTDSGIAATDVATIDADAVEGNIAEFDGNGNPVDSGHALSEYKTKQTAVADSDATTSGNDTTFVDSVTQDTNGEISVHKKTVPNVSASTSGTGGTNGLMLATDKEKLDGLLECSDSDIDSIFA